MNRSVLLLIAMLTAQNGCANPHAHKPAAELRTGITPITSEVRYDATYALVRTDQPGPPLYTTRLLRGEMVGFRHDLDQSVVAVASGITVPLGDGEFAWVLADESAPNWRERAGRDCKEFGASVCSAFALTGMAIIGVGAAVAFGIASAPR